MQTFLPYDDFDKSFAVLDRKRLGNQVWREGLTLLRGGWPNHPASKMWRKHRLALAEYCRVGVAHCERVYGKKYPHLYDSINEAVSDETGAIVMPDWFGMTDFHAAHRSNLLRKDPVWYGQFKWSEPDDLEYIWPV